MLTAEEITTPAPSRYSYKQLGPKGSCGCGSMLHEKTAVLVGQGKYSCPDCIGLLQRKGLARCSNGSQGRYSYTPAVDRHFIDCECCEHAVVGSTLQAVVVRWNKENKGRGGIVIQN